MTLLTALRKKNNPTYLAFCISPPEQPSWRPLVCFQSRPLHCDCPEKMHLDSEDTVVSKHHSLFAQFKLQISQCMSAHLLKLNLDKTQVLVSNSSGPSYILKMVKPYTPAYPLHSATANQLAPTSLWVRPSRDQIDARLRACVMIYTWAEALKSNVACIEDT